MKHKEKPYLRLCATITGQLGHQLKALFIEHLPLWTEPGGSPATLSARYTFQLRGRLPAIG